MSEPHLAAILDHADAEIRALEDRLDGGAGLPLGATVDAAQAVAKRLIKGYLGAATDKPVPQESADLLALWKLLVKGDPSWNTIRDNCRELVYYRNCLDEGRPDALPREPARMAVRTTRHLHLFIKSRCEQEGRL